MTAVIQVVAVVAFSALSAAVGAGISTGLGMGVPGAIMFTAIFAGITGTIGATVIGYPQDMVEKLRSFYIRRYLDGVGIPYVLGDTAPRYIQGYLWRPWHRLRRRFGAVAGAAAWRALTPSGSELFSQACDVVELAMKDSELLSLPDEELVPLMLVLAPAVSDLGVPDGKALCALVDEAVEQYPVHAFSGLLKSGDVISNIRALNAGVAPEYILAM